MSGAPDLDPEHTTPPTEPPTEPTEQPKPPPARSVAARLVDLVTEQYRLGRTPEGEPFALPRTGPRQHIAMMLRGGKIGLRSTLAREYFDRTGNVPGSGALSDALTVVQGMAESEAPTRLGLRVVEHDGALWVDRGDDAGTVVKITPGHVATVTEPPVLFRRSELTAELPMPVGSGSVDLGPLWEQVNVDEADRPLLLAWMVAALMPEIARPILTLTGEQGTGKSTAARLLVELLDPSPAPLRSAPRNLDELPLTLAASHVIALDNLSTISDPLSDALCTVVTGQGTVRRALYTDNGMRALSLRRSLILTGIDFAGLRGDLTERMVLVQLHRLPPAARRTDRDMTEAWARDRPGILGSLYSLAALVLAELPHVELAGRPRMADFATVLAAVDHVTGSTGLARYGEQATSLAADTLTGNPFIAALVASPFVFTGTAAELLAKVDPPDAAKPPRDWPKNARAVTTALRRYGPALRANGWHVEIVDLDRNKTAIWAIDPPED